MNIYQSITAIMTDGYSISKDKKNQQQGFRYRGIDDVMNTFYPLLSKHKVFLVPEVLDARREERQTNKGGNLIYSMLTIRYTFFAEDGSSVSAVVIGEGMDSGDKASNKAMAVAMKYAMFQVFCIPTEDMEDPDATTPEPSVPAKKTVEPPRSAPAEPPADASMHYCTDCGKPILTTFKPDGTLEKTAAEYWGYSRKTFGRDMCRDCIIVASKLQSAKDKAKVAAE